MSRTLEAKKLVLVSATSTSMTGIRKEALEQEETIERIPYIHYLVHFKIDTSKVQVQTLIDSGSEVNAIHPAFAKQLSLSIRLTNVGFQKIDGITLDIYEMVVATFSMEDKANWVRFFEETFLVANVSPEIVLGMLFFILSGIDVDFLGWELR